MTSSRIYKWITNRSERFESETAFVNIDYLKIVLHERDCPVMPRSIRDIAYAFGSSKLVLNSTSTRLVRPADIQAREPEVPVILSLVPTRFDGNGCVIWAPDIVDGFHRIACAKLAGFDEIPFVMVCPDQSFIATRPKAQFTGPISKETDFFVYNPPGGIPEAHWEEFHKTIGLRY